jgi:hypothetical protein
MNKGQIAVSFLALSVVTLLLVGTGCGAAQRLRQVPVTGAEAFVPGQELAIDVQNAFGSVSIEVDPKIEAPTVWVFAKGDTAEKTKPTWAAAGLDSVDGLPVLRIATENPEGEPSRDYVVRVRVPHCAGVRVRNTGGSVRVTGVRGAVDISNDLSGSSDSEAIFVRMSEGSLGPILLNAQAGNIELRLPATHAGILSAASGDGQVRVDAAPATVKGVNATTNRWDGVVNGGDQPITLRTGRGMVKVLIGR